MLRAMKKWNRTGQIKALIIFLIPILSLMNMGVKETLDAVEIWEGILVGIILFIPISLFLFITIKLWSFFGFRFLKADWNYNPLKGDIFKNVFTFWQFFGYFSFAMGVSKVIAQIVVLGQVEGGSIIFTFVGLSLIIFAEFSPKIAKIDDGDQ